jgi:adenylylsulfate kinase
MAQPVDNLSTEQTLVSPRQREALLRQKGAVLWFTGLSGSGKSTIARAVEALLMDQGHLAYVLDGDNIRQGLNAGLGFSPEEREENLRRIAEVAKLFAECGVLALTAFISPTRESRDRARGIIGEERFCEVHIATPLETCEARDVKGLYHRARKGEIPDFTGIHSPYEAPDKPFLRIETEGRSVEACARLFVSRLREREFLGHGNR